MNYELILEDLNKWGSDELVYKEYYEMEKTVENIEAFYEKYRRHPELRVPAMKIMHPETLITHSTESHFIQNGYNIAIVKHPRFSPSVFHEHIYFEMIYVVSGCCRHRYSHQEFFLNKGDICILSPGTVHAVEVHDESVILNVLIRKSTFIDIFMSIIRDDSPIGHFFQENMYSSRRSAYLLFHTTDDTVVRNYVLDMYIEQLNQDTQSDRIMCSLLTIFFAQLTRRYKRSVEFSRDQSSDNSLANEITSCMLANYHDISLEKLAEKFHFSPSYCSKVIKESTGYTFSELLTDIRLQQGERLLLSTPLPIVDISTQIGYKNPETFIRAFQRRYAQTPSQYRKSNYRQ